MVPWISGYDSRLGDAGTLFACCDVGAPDFDDGSADGLACLVVEDNVAAGADIQVSVVLVSVGMCGCRITLAQVFGQPLLVAGVRGWINTPECVAYLTAT